MECATVDWEAVKGIVALIVFGVVGAIAVWRL